MKKTHFTKTIGMKKSSRVTSKICCWKCSRSDITLYRVLDDEGKKTQDNICRICRGLGYYNPPIGNSSRIAYHYPEDDVKGEHGKTI